MLMPQSLGTTIQRSWLGQYSSQYDPMKALQGRLALEQWEWQKRLHQQQQAAADRAGTAMSRLVKQFGTGTTAARQANEARYQQMLNIARGETARQAGIQQQMLGAVGQETGQRAADIRSEGAGREADIMQQLARQGMAGTTVAPTMQEGVRRGTQESLNRLADQMLGRRLGVLGQIAAPRHGTQLGIMERRADAYPDPNLLVSLASSLGQGGAGGGIAEALSKMRLS